MIHLRTINLEKFDKKKYYDLMSRLERDENVKRYFSKNLEVWLEKHQAVSDDKIEVGKTYVIVKEHKYIGIVGSLSFSSNGILEVCYAIDKDFRGNGYGEKILAEITPYLIEHVDDLKDIKLKIDKENIASKKVAERNGYLLEEETKDTDVYYYFGKKHK